MESKIRCQCAPLDANGNKWAFNECYYCRRCHRINCPLCLLAIPLTKTCYRCALHTDDPYKFTCKRCYSCPKCKQDIDSRVDLYTRNDKGNLVKLKDRSYKVAGKLVTLKCSKCEYQTKTPIETKPQGLTKMVRKYTESTDEKRFGALEEAIKNTIKQHVTTKKPESILNKPSKEDSKNIVQQLESLDLSLKPIPKSLTVEKRAFKCVTCLDTISSSDLRTIVPKVVSVLPSNYRDSSGPLQQTIPVLLNFINDANVPLKVQILKPNADLIPNRCELVSFPLNPFEIPCVKGTGESAAIPTRDKILNEMPTSLLPRHLLQFPELKTELTNDTKRRVRNLLNLKFDASNADHCFEIVEMNANWITFCVYIKLGGDRNTTLSFDIILSITKDETILSLQEECIIKV